MKRERLLHLYDQMRMLRRLAAGTKPRRPPRPSMKWKTEGEKRETLVKAILEKLLEGPCTQWKLADYAGRCSVGGYPAALAVMRALRDAGVLATTKGTGRAWSGTHWHLLKRGPGDLGDNAWNCGPENPGSMQSGQ